MAIPALAPPEMPLELDADAVEEATEVGEDCSNAPPVEDGAVVEVAVEKVDVG